MTVTTTTPTLNPAAVTPDYHTLKKMITQLQASGPAGHVLPLLVQILGHPVLLSAMLKRISSDARWLEKVQRASYYHRNGFDKIVLVESDSFKLRLHHFRPQPETLPAENIHDHRWPFASAIVSGKLRMRMYEATHWGKLPVHEYRYHSNKVNGRYNCESMGSTGLTQVDEKVYEAGTHYFMHTTTLHRIVHMPGEEAVTLILTGKPERADCRLYATGELLDEDMELETYTRNHLEQIISGLANSIQKKE